MANHNRIKSSFHSGELLFIAIVKLTLREKSYWHFRGERLDILAEYFGVNGDITEIIKKKVAKIKKCYKL